LFKYLWLMRRNLSSSSSYLNVVCDSITVRRGCFSICCLEFFMIRIDSWRLIREFIWLTKSRWVVYDAILLLFKSAAELSFVDFLTISFEEKGFLRVPSGSSAAGETLVPSGCPLLRWSVSISIINKLLSTKRQSPNSSSLLLDMTAYCCIIFFWWKVIFWLFPSSWEFSWLIISLVRSVLVKRIIILVIGHVVQKSVDVCCIPWEVKERSSSDKNWWWFWV